jgi:hypothetical protein
MVTEQAHPLASPALAEAHDYGTFTARYGNIYTARQLLQLFQRAHEEFTPLEDVWKHADGRHIDPFRPRIQPDGFLSLEEFRADRSQHFAAVRQAFKTLDVLIFTLGLTECWYSKLDGAVYPLCPGVSGGAYDAARYGYTNFGVSETVADLKAFVERLRRVNPRAKLILTVSPVPLIATAEPRHVLVSTTYSKSVLRVACEEVSKTCADVAYFPSYEIITGAYTRGAYFAEDQRSVTEGGVSHVMSLFFKHCTTGEQPKPNSAPKAGPRRKPTPDHLEAMANLVQVNCDEEALAAEHEELYQRPTSPKQ